MSNKGWVRRSGSAATQQEEPAKKPKPSKVADKQPYDQIFEEVFSIFQKHHPNAIVRYTKEIIDELTEFFGTNGDASDGQRYVKCLTRDFLEEGASRGKSWKTKKNIGVRFDGTYFIVGKIEFLRGLDNLGMRFVTATVE